MEIFTGRVGLRLLKSPGRFYNGFTPFQKPYAASNRHHLCLLEGPKITIALFETHTRQLFSNHVFKIDKSNGHNLRSLFRLYSDQPIKDSNGIPTTVKKPNIFQKMKQMTKDYWHVLVPVHVITSVGWMLIFYTAAKNSVDVIWIMEKLHFSERYIDALRGSSAGFWAVAYALYKICTPVRYMVTVGGTTLSIKYLNRMGYLKTKLKPSSVQHKESPGKLECKDGQRQAEPPKT